jgi:PleD family two-component response regulator
MVPVQPADSDTIDELLARADELMYEEKKGKPTSRPPA